MPLSFTISLRWGAPLLYPFDSLSLSIQETKEGKKRRIGTTASSAEGRQSHFATKELEHWESEPPTTAKRMAQRGDERGGGAVRLGKEGTQDVGGVSATRQGEKNDGAEGNKKGQWQGRRDKKRCDRECPIVGHAEREGERENRNRWSQCRCGSSLYKKKRKEAYPKKKT